MLAKWTVQLKPGFNFWVRENLPWTKALLSRTISLNLSDFDERKKKTHKRILNWACICLQYFISISLCIAYYNKSEYLKTDDLNIVLYGNKTFCKSTLLFLSEPQEVIDMSSPFSKMKKTKHKEILQLPYSVLMEKLGPCLESWNFHPWLIKLCFLKCEWFKMI